MPGGRPVSAFHTVWNSTPAVSHQSPTPERRRPLEDRRAPSGRPARCRGTAPRRRAAHTSRRMPDARREQRGEQQDRRRTRPAGRCAPWCRRPSARCSTRRRAGSRPATSRTRPKFTGYSAPLVEGTSVTRGSIATACAQRPGQRLELGLDDVVGVAAGVEHPHVQADPRVEGEATPARAGSGWSGSPARSSASCPRARRARSTAGRTGRRRPATSTSSSGIGRVAEAGDAALVAERLARTPGPSAIATSSTVWWASMSRSPSACTVRSMPPCLASAVEHVVVEADAGADVELARCRRGRARRPPWSRWWPARRVRCGSCGQSPRAARCPGATSPSAARKASVSSGGAGGDPQPAGQPDVADQHAAVEQRLPGRVRVGEARRTARSWRRCGTLVSPMRRQRGDDPVALRLDRVDRGRAARRCAPAPRARRPGSAS